LFPPSRDTFNTRNTRRARALAPLDFDARHSDDSFDPPSHRRSTDERYPTLRCCGAVAAPRGLHLRPPRARGCRERARRGRAAVGRRRAHAAARRRAQGAVSSRVSLASSHLVSRPTRCPPADPRAQVPQRPEREVSPRLRQKGRGAHLRIPRAPSPQQPEREVTPRLRRRARRPPADYGPHPFHRDVQSEM
jgi:hypothetical protein